jgi:hypothetical protein
MSAEPVTLSAPTPTTYVAVTRRQFPASDPYWLPLGPQRGTRSRAAGDGINVATDLKTGLEFVLAVVEGGDVVRVLDRSGDPLDGWDAEGLRRVRDGINEILDLEES